MTLRYCHPAPVLKLEEIKEKEIKKRPLAVLLSWMLAKDKHLERYRVLYFKRGFDVLTVKTEPIELLFPTRGSHPIAKNLISFLNEAVKQYPDVLVHAFSVGAYQFGELLVQMQNRKNQFKPEVIDSVKTSIKGNF